MPRGNKSTTGVSPNTTKRTNVKQAGSSSSGKSKGATGVKPAKVSPSKAGMKQPGSSGIKSSPGPTNTSMGNRPMLKKKGK